MSDRHQSRIRRPICAIRGHNWESVEHVPMHVNLNLDAVVGKCSRCGKDGTARDATSYDENGPRIPAELLEQPPEQEIRVLYKEGMINKEKMEKLMEKSVCHE